MFLQDKMSWDQMYGEMMVYKENVYVNWHYEKFGLAFVIKQNWTTFGEEKDQEFLHSFQFLEQKVYLVYSWIQKPTTFTLISSSFVFLTHTAIWFERKNVKRQKVNESVQVLRSVHSSLTPSMLTAGEVLSQTQTGSWEFSFTNIYRWPYKSGKIENANLTNTFYPIRNFELEAFRLPLLPSWQIIWVFQRVQEDLETPRWKSKGGIWNLKVGNPFTILPFKWVNEKSEA